MTTHKTFKSFVEEIETTDEALTNTQRLQRKRTFQKNKAKIALGKKKAAHKIADTDTLKSRARKKARMQIFKKITKDKGKDELSFSKRQDIEKRLDKMSPKIDNIARKLLPQVRKDELAKKRGSKND